MSTEAIRNALHKVLAQHANFPQLLYAPNDLFEIYILGLVLEAAKEENATISFRDANGQVASSLRFRRSPGTIQRTGDFTHLLIEFPGLEAIEAHLGVMVLGVSGIAHECDVAVLKASEAERSRQFSIQPRSQGLLVALEAKYYAVPLTLSLGRGLLGLSRELFGRPTVLASNIAADDIVHMVLHHKLHANDNVSPGSSDERRLREYLKREFHKFRR